MHQQVLAESPPLVSLIDRGTSEQYRGERWAAREFPYQCWRERARLDSRRGERIVNDCLPRCGSERHQPAIATLQRQLLMQRSGTERLKMGCTMFDTARALMRAGLGDAKRAIGTCFHLHRALLGERYATGTPRARSTAFSTSIMRALERLPPRAFGKRRSRHSVVICSHFATDGRGKPPSRGLSRT
jgi:hypothetical protein